MTHYVFHRKVKGFSIIETIFSVSVYLFILSSIAILASAINKKYEYHMSVNFMNTIKDKIIFNMFQTSYPNFNKLRFCQNIKDIQHLLEPIVFKKAMKNNLSIHYLDARNTLESNFPRGKLTFMKGINVAKHVLYNNSSTLAGICGTLKKKEDISQKIKEWEKQSIVFVLYWPTNNSYVICSLFDINNWMKNNHELVDEAFDKFSN